MKKTIQYNFIFSAIVVLISVFTVQNTSAQTKLYELYSGSVSVAFSPDGKYIATGDADGDVGLWEVSNGENIYYRSIGGTVQGVDFSPDGKYIAADGAGGGVRIILMEASGAREIDRLDLVDEANHIHSVAYSPDGRHVAIGDDTGRAYLWDVNSGRWSWWTSWQDELYSVAFSPNGEYLATGDSDGYARLWEVSSWWTDDVNTLDFKPGGNVRAVAFSPNGRYLAADAYDGNNTSVIIYDVVSGRSVQQIDPDVYEVNALAFSPDGQYLAVGGTDPEIIVYRIGTEVITLVTAITRETTIQASDEVLDLAWSPDGNLISDGRAVYRMLVTPTVINPTGIGIDFPDNLISEEAFSTNSTYFIVKAKYPRLRGVAGANILYGSCIITLHIPDSMQGFVFPIKTKEKEVQDARVDIILSLGSSLIPGLGLAGTLVDALKLFSKVNDLENRDLKIELHTDARHREPPETEAEFIVLLKHPINGRPNEIDITIEQQYRDTNRGSTRINKVYETKHWIFDGGWAAPTAQVTVFDYPQFQLLPAEVQQYLLLQFSEFGTTERGLIPAETALLRNYPNPFNPETWIPYQLSESTDVAVSIYSMDGQLVRTLDLGHQAAGIYHSKSRAAYWDGRNGLGERVASGLYFYTFTAGDFTATRKMLIRK